MTYLITLSILGTILVLFVCLTVYESKTDTRVFPRLRYRFDRKVTRLEFIVQHVDWGAFSADVARTAVLRVVHDIAHGTLLAVRTLERLLTRLVRSLRTQRPTAPITRQSLATRARAAMVYMQKAVREARRGSEDEGSRGITHQQPE